MSSVPQSPPSNAWPPPEDSVRKSTQSEQWVVLTYDGQCPLCRYAVEDVVMPAAKGSSSARWTVEDARHGREATLRLWAQGVPLNRGFCLQTDTDLYVGWRALHQLGLRLELKTPWWQKRVLVSVRRQWVARLLYPIFVGLRWVVLRVSGVVPLRPPDP